MASQGEAENVLSLEPDVVYVGLCWWQKKVLVQVLVYVWVCGNFKKQSLCGTAILLFFSVFLSFSFLSCLCDVSFKFLLCSVDYDNFNRKWHSTTEFASTTEIQTSAEGSTHPYPKRVLSYK